MENKDSINSVVFFISTGRCGTQFFADKLAANYKDMAVVIHEPFHLEYKPRYNFSSFHRNEGVDLSPTIERHINFISETLRNSHYIETGWPVYGLLPHMISCFHGRVKVVHLYRHPLKVAASLTTHSVYSRGEWSEIMSISPIEHGVIQSHLAGETWGRMSEFEKCLFWWSEVNHFALRLHDRFPQTPWMSLKFEDIFYGDDRSELMRLVSFLGIPNRTGFANSLEEKTDRFSTKTRKDLDISSLTSYPLALQLMEQFGYDNDESVIQDINLRYQMSVRELWQDGVFRMCRRVYKKLCDLTRRFFSYQLLHCA